MNKEELENKIKSLDKDLISYLIEFKKSFKLFCKHSEIHCSYMDKYRDEDYKKHSKFIKIDKIYKEVAKKHRENYKNWNTLDLEKKKLIEQIKKLN